MITLDLSTKRIAVRQVMIKPYIGFIAAIHIKTGSYSIGTISELTTSGILVDDNEGNNFLIKWEEVTLVEIRGEGDWSSAQGGSNESKTERIVLRVKFADLVLIKQSAKRAGKKVGPFVLNAALDKARRTKVLL